MAANFSIGDLVNFTYTGDRVHDSSPLVLVLHDNWEGLVHGLNFNYLSRDEINFMRMMLDPDFADMYSEKLGKMNPSLGRELNRMQGVYDSLNITSPYDFYQRFVRKFIKPRGWDPYRRYRPDKISGSRVVRKRQVLSGDVEKSVFDKFRDKFEFMRGPRFK